MPIKINGEYGYVPYAYAADVSATKPPFTVNYDPYDDTYSVDINWLRTQASYQDLFRQNLNSPLWIKCNGVLKEPYATIITQHDNQEHLILTFGNGNYVTLQCSSISSLHFYFRYADSTIASDWVQSVDLTLDNQKDYYFTLFIDDNDVVFGGLGRTSRYSSLGYVEFYSGRLIPNGANQSFFTKTYAGLDPYSTDDNNTPSGGYGNFDYTSEDEIPPSLPSLSASNAGFVTLWNPTISEVGNLADYLWGPTFSVASWQKLWNDPMECLLSLGIVPVAPTTGTRANIYFGNADTGIESAPITTQFVTADMGTMHIDGQSASYMDYAPYAKASIYLPYCGTYALDVDEIMDADLALEYHIDIYTGACVAYLTINNRTNSDGSVVHNVMYQFTGNCLASIPVTSGDHSQLLQSLLFMGASIAATVATSGAASAGGAIEGLAAEGDVVASSGVLGAATAGSAINTVMSMKPNVMHSGNLSSTAGLLGSQKPFVTFTWSNLCRPDDEYQLVGMPIQKSGTLSDFEGFTIVSACHMDNILCTDAERSMIEQALGRGVII